MSYRRIFITVLILAFISGCSDFMMICSLNPFYLEKDVVLNPQVEGTWKVHPLEAKSNSDNNFSWKSTDTIFNWIIAQKITQETRKNSKGKDSVYFMPEKFYIVKLAHSSPDSAKYQFKMVLFKINGATFADFSPYQIEAIEKNSMTKENLVAGHTLAKVSFFNNQLSVSWLGTDYMKDMIQDKRVRIKYRYIPSIKRLILTASSEQLSAMIGRYAFETRFIDWEDQPAMLNLERQI